MRDNAEYMYSIVLLIEQTNDFPIHKIRNTKVFFLLLLSGFPSIACTLELKRLSKKNGEHHVLV